MAAVRPQPNTRTGPAHFSGRNVLAESESKRSPLAASAAPRKATHRVSCCTKTTDPGIPVSPSSRATISTTGSSDITEIAPMARAFSPLPRARHTPLARGPATRPTRVGHNDRRIARKQEETIAEIAGLTDENVCPTLARKGLRYCGAGAFACQQPAVPQSVNELLRPRT